MVAQRPGPPGEGVGGDRAPLDRAPLGPLPPVAAPRLSPAVGGRRRAGTAPPPPRPRPDLSQDTHASRADDSEAAAICESRVSRQGHNAVPKIGKTLTLGRRPARRRSDKLALPR